VEPEDVGKNKVIVDYFAFTCVSFYTSLHIAVTAIIL
jgi:hypothetical protein